MSLSRKWTAGAFFKHAAAGLPTMDGVAFAQRFEIMNLLQLRIVNQFFGLMWSAYMTPIVMTIDTTGHTQTSGTTWTTATKTLLGTFSPVLSSSDIGKLVVFRISTAYYSGIINSVPGATSMTLIGSNLPVSDNAVDETMVINTVVANDMISLSGIDMIRAGDQVKLELESTATTAVLSVNQQELSLWRTSSTQNRNKIIWSLSGDTINLKRGDNLANYGTLTLRYPRSPIDVAQDADFIDIMDGIPASLMMLLLKRELADRYAHTKVDYSQDIDMLVKGLFANAGVYKTAPEIQANVEALV